MEREQPSAAPSPAPWPRHPTRPPIVPELIGAAVAGLTAAILGLIGLILMTTADLDLDNTTAKFHGEMLVFLAVVFATLMLGLAFTAGRLALPRLSPAPLAAAIGCAAVAIALGIVGLIKSYAGDPSFLDSSGVWLPYAEIWAIVATAVMVGSRPLHPAFARVLPIPFVVAAIAFGIVGAVIGLGDEETAVPRGLGWMGFGAMWANLAVAAWFGARPTGAGATGAGP